MSRAALKGKSKATDPPRREHFEQVDDDRSAPRYRTDDRMEIDDDDYDDPIDYRRGDRIDRSDRRGVRRDNPRDEDWDDRRDPRREDNRGLDRRDRSDDHRDAASDDLMSTYIPTTGIEWEVISGDIQIYLGPEATVEIVPDPQDSRRDLYLVRAKNNTLTQHMLLDLKADSHAWRRQQERTSHPQIKQPSYTATATHYDRERNGPSRRLPVAPTATPRPDTFERHRSETSQPVGAGYAIGSYAMAGPPPAQGTAFAQSPAQARNAPAPRSQDQSFLTREEAELIIARRLREVGRAGVTRSQLEHLIDQALGQVSQSQEQILTRDQAQRIIAQRLKDSGNTTVSRSQLEDLVNKQIEKSKQQNIDRVVDEAIQKGQDRPVANQGRPASQAAPGGRPPPRQPSPDGTFGHHR